MSNYNFDYIQYKKTIYKKNPFAFSLIFLLIIILLGLCVFFKPTYNKYYKFHFVEIDCFATYKDALSLSNSIQERGGAGYIYYDNEYHVLASFYSKHDDAKSIANNLKTNYKNCNVFTIETKKIIKSSSLNSSQNNAVKNLVDTLRNKVFDIENLTNDFDTKKISYNKLSIYIKNIQEEFNEVYNKFLNAFKSLSKYNLAKEHLQEIKNSFKTISNTLEEKISQTLRYHNINIAINLYRLSSCF